MIALGLGLTARSARQSWLLAENAVRDIFASYAPGYNGVWYDPSDLSTMFQDSAGTTPVTAVEQSVGLILDKSGRGNHASQATTGYKPVLKQDANGCYYLKFDGIDDFLVTGNVDFSASDKIAVAAGVRKLSDATAAVIAETSSNAASNDGAFGISGPNGAGQPRYGCIFRGTVSVSASAVGFAAPVSTVISVTDTIGSDDIKLRANGVQVSYSASDQGTGKFGNYPLYIGRRGGTSLPFNGHLYGLVILGGLDDITKLREIERLLAKKTGVTI